MSSKYPHINSSTPSTALQFFIEKASKIQGVEEVYVFMKEEAVDIWTVISEYNFDTELKVSEIQCELTRIFNALSFNFLILARRNRHLNDLIPKNGVKIYP